MRTFKNWPTRRKDIRLLESILKKTKKIIDLEHAEQEINLENYQNVFPWIPRTIEKFRVVYRKTWLANMLRAIDEVLKDQFESKEQEEMIVDAISFSIKAYIALNKLQSTYILNPEDMERTTSKAEEEHAHHHHDHDGPCNHHH